MRSRLREAELGREKWKAVAGGRRHQDARHVQRVEDVGFGIPQPRCAQELQVEASPVADRLAAADEIDQLGHRGLGGGGALEVGLRDPGQPGDRVRQRPLRVDKPLQRSQRAVGRERHRAHLDHSIAGRIETGGLEVKGYVLRHRWGFYGCP